MIDDKLADDARVTHPIIIYVFGGVSGLQLGSRGPSGKTADCDYMFLPQTPNAHKAAFQDAVTRFYWRNSDRLADDYLNSAVETFLDAAHRTSIVQSSTAALFRGDKGKLFVNHADFGAQLVNKMDKITKSILRSGLSVERKDIQDAAAFLFKACQANGNARINNSELRQFSTRMDLRNSLKEIIVNSARLIQNSYGGFAQDILDIAEEEDSS